MPLLAGFLAVLVTGGCGATVPYIYKPAEFDRNSPDFNKELKDRDSVTICYSSMATPLSEVEEIAAAECGRFGKTAWLAAKSFGECPLLTPVVARFDCRAP
jgi:hypothetical protein